MSDLLELSIASLAGLVAAGEAASIEVADVFRRRALAVGAELGCFVAFEEADTPPDEAAATARALEGVPFAVKDMFVEPGHMPTAGLPSAGLSLRGSRSAALERLRTAGAVSLGWLNLDPLGYAALGTNPELGTTSNPWNAERISGGSSSGAAAAVASRAVVFAVGTDTGGSSRIPAAFCGVVGFKPTFGRVPRTGAVPLSYSQDTVGILAKTAEDVATVLDVMAGYEPSDPASIDVPVRPHRATVLAVQDRAKPLAGVRVGVDVRLLDRVEPVSRDLLEAALRSLCDLGATRVEVDLSVLADIDVAATVLTWSEAGAVHLDGVRRGAYDQAPAVAARLQAGLLTSGAHHVDAMRYQGLASRKFTAEVLSQVDLLATPTTPGPPPAISEVLQGSQADSVALSLSLLSLNRPFNFLGLPAVSMPVGFDAQRMPVGLQLAAAPWRDPELLAAVAAYQAVTDWHRYSPPSLAAGRLP